ncbi:hypothetical protein ACEWY4_000880 [Coilia grayii]|uniref:Uncharacterized protein n=1 Tax=Coilia grayii TaxID=363190 RepID=A0ABD1KXZ8_9TELE
MDDENNALLNIGYELSLCDLNDLDLIKGVAPPLRQLGFLERLISLVSDPVSGNSSAAAVDDSFSSADGAVSRGSESSKWTDRLMRELMSNPTLLQQLQSSKLSPLPPTARGLWSTLAKTSSAGETANAKQEVFCLKSDMGSDVSRSNTHVANATGMPIWVVYSTDKMRMISMDVGTSQTFSTSCGYQQGAKQQKSVPRKVSEAELQETRDQLLVTKNTLEELQKECEFLESGMPLPTSPPRHPYSPCKLRVASSDLQQLMSTFGHVYYDFKVYCEKPPPKPPLNTDTFQTVGQLLQASNMELKMYDHLTDTSSSVTDNLTDLQTEKHFYTNGEMQSLTDMLESLKRKYSGLLSTPHDDL